MAHYFKYFPKMVYDIKGDGNQKLVVDILRRVKMRDGIKNNVALYDKYNIGDGEKPEDVSYAMYDTVDYYWVILLMNNIKDRFYDWPLSQTQFNNYVTGKYTNPNGVHHYEIVQSSGPTFEQDNSHLVEVNSTQAGATTVTNYEYEQRLQDEKRQIKILNRRYLGSFVSEFKRLVRN